MSVQRFDQRPDSATSANLLSTTKVRLYRDGSGRATLHPRPIVHQPSVEKFSTPRESVGTPEPHASTVTRPAFSAILRGDGTLAPTFAQGERAARQVAADYAASPEGQLAQLDAEIAEMERDAAMRIKYPTRVAAKPVRKSPSAADAAAAAAADAILAAILGF